MGIFDTNQNPFIQSQQSLAPIHTGTIFDPLIGLASQLRSQQNDQVIAQKAQQDAIDAQTRQDDLIAQKFQQQKDIANLTNTNTIAREDAKQKTASAKQTVKDAAELKRNKIIAKKLGITMADDQLKGLKPSDLKLFKKETSKSNTTFRDKTLLNGSVQSTIVTMDGQGNVTKETPFGAPRLPKAGITVYGPDGNPIVTTGNPMAATDAKDKRDSKNTIRAGEKTLFALDSFESLAKASNFGVAGKIKGLAQNIQQQIPAIVNVTNEFVRGLSIPDDSKQLFLGKLDTTLPAQEYWANTLTAMQALQNNPNGGKISDSDWKIAERQVNSKGITATKGNALAALAQFRRSTQFSINQAQKSLGSPLTDFASTPPQATNEQTLPASAVSSLKEGHTTTFRNGQKWTLENGAPKRIK